MSFEGFNYISKTGVNPPKKRFSNAMSLRTVYEHLGTEDQVDAKRRSTIRRVYDGFKPYDPESLRMSGLRSITNVNFLGLRGLIENRATNILRLAQDTTPLVELQPVSKELAGPDAVKISRIIADEFSSLLRCSGRFIPALAMMNKEADLYGIGPVTWPSNIDYVPLALERGQLRFIGTGPVNSSEHDLFMFETTVQASFFFQILDYPDIAERQGWNVDAVKKLVVAAFRDHSETANQPGVETSTTPLEEEISRMRRMGVFESRQFDDVKIINAYVKELAYPRGITQYVIPGTPVDEKNDSTSFLFEKENAFDNMDQVLLWFPYSVTERYAKDVRGIATYLLPIEDVKNRIQCSLCDAAIRSTSFILNRKTPGRASELSVVESGPYTVVDADLVPVQQQVAPSLQDAQAMTKALTDLGISVTTGMDELPINRDDKLYSPSTRQTKAMVQQQEDSKARHEEALFLQRISMLDKLFQECYRRFMDLAFGPSAISKNYPEIKSFFERCELRMLDKETIKKANDSFIVQTCRDLVIGSEGKTGFLQELLSTLGGSLDEDGRRSAVRDIVTLKLGDKSADRYTPEASRDKEQTDAASFATLENNAMKNKLQVMVGSNQLHWAHIPIHSQVLQEITDAVKQNQMEDPQSMLQILQGASEHIQEHLKFGSMQIGMEGQTKEVEAMLRGLVPTTKALNLAVTTQERVQQAQQEKEQRAQEDLQKKADENELNAAKYKADKEAEIQKYREDKLHEARMEGLRLRGEESNAKIDMNQQQTEAKINNADAETQQKLDAAGQRAASMSERLDQRASISGYTPPPPEAIAGEILPNNPSQGLSLML